MARRLISEFRLNSEDQLGSHLHQLLFQQSGRRTDSLFLRKLCRLDLLRISGRNGVFLVEVAKPEQGWVLVAKISEHSFVYFGECYLGAAVAVGEDVWFQKPDGGLMSILEINKIEFLERHDLPDIAY